MRPQNISLYDLHVEHKHVPYVESTPPVGMEHLQAGDVMTRPAITFEMIEKVGSLHSILTSNSHNGFPVVSSGEDGNHIVRLSPL